MIALKQVLSRTIGVLLRPVSSRLLARALFFPISAAAIGRPAKSSLVFLLELERLVENLTGMESCRYGNGVHSKHRHTRYHEFFAGKLRSGERVLDIGCGYGALAADMAKSGAQITAIDQSASNIEFAKKYFQKPNINYIEGTAPQDIPRVTIDTVVMSNVLEHMDKRTEFIRATQRQLSPARWLIRVPMYERDWRVPLMEELGVDYRLDDTHFIEYRYSDLESELNAAGLAIRDATIRWGEIWCEAIPVPGKLEATEI